MKNLNLVFAILTRMMVAGEVIVVAVDASKEITDYALEWAMRNLAKPSDSFFLLAILPSKTVSPGCVHRTHQSKTSQFLSSLLKRWGIKHNEKGSSDNTALIKGVEPDVIQRVNNVCNLMMQNVFSNHKVDQVQGEVKIIADAEPGSAATASGELGASWVVVDRQLKKESDCCLKQLVCNVVLMDHATPRILRAADPQILKKLIKGRKKDEPAVADTLGVVPANNSKDHGTHSSLGFGSQNSKIKSSSSLSTVEKDSFHIFNVMTTNVKRNSSHRQLDSQYFHQDDKNQVVFSPSLTTAKHRLVKKVPNSWMNELPHRESVSLMEPKRKSYSGPLKTKTDVIKGNSIKALNMVPVPARRSVDSPHLWQKSETPGQLKELTTRKDPLTSHDERVPEIPSIADRISNIRQAMSLSIKHPPTPPPLCSICKHNAPHFGKAPRKFSYKEIERATNGFAVDNFLAEGGFGSVYRGVLTGGQVIAVKQHKFLSAQGASEFCSEVEVLSCAQHKNLVMLVGYCIETEWLLVYEFACNGSLDKHLYGKESAEVMTWHDRMKVALGAARGLRYLHEDCRVGCIIHRDFRPSNILLTHDYEPMVGDFGLARWQADGQLAEETRVLGSLGYLAPEYTQTGLITEKSDVYAYGVVLLELLSGFKATEFSRERERQFVSDWGLPLLKRWMMKELTDPRLQNNYVKREVEHMMHAAELCLSPSPEQRPRMSQVLRTLDGDMPGNMTCPLGDLISNYDYENLNCHANSWLMHNVHQSPSRLKEPKRNDQDITRSLRLLSISDGCAIERNDYISAGQEETCLSGEYQAYLQGSLAKFIQNMKTQ